VNSDIETLAAISAGYKRGEARLEAQRIKDIKDSNTEMALKSFDLAFKSIMLRPLVRNTFALTKLQRVLFGVDT
jgi:hypothetical protein